MLSEIFRFELRQHLRSPLFWVGGGLLFLIGFLVVSVGAVAADIGGAVGGVHRNAPYVVMQSFLQLSLLGIFVATAFVAGAVVRDHEHGMDEIFFSAPIDEGDYLLGRFGGAFLASLLLFVFVVAAFLLGGAMPWIGPDELGPFRARTYLYSFGVIVLPNLFLFAAIAFAAATATQRIMYSYVAVIVVIGAYFISRNLLGDLATEGLAALFDPFGAAPLSTETKYWTTAERNRRLVSLTGVFLWNRILWLGVAGGLFAAVYARFSFTARPRSRRRDDRAETEAVTEPPTPRSRDLAPPSARPAFGGTSSWHQLLHRIAHETSAAVRSIPFLVILGMGLLVFTSNALALEQFVGGMRPLPVTRLMVGIVNYFILYVWILLAVYAAELCWRERVAGAQELTDALPAPTWVLWGGVLGALTVIVTIALLLATGVGITVQLAQGYTELEPGLYLRGVFLANGIPLLHFAVLALVVQVVVNHRFAGYLGLLVVGLGFGLLWKLGLQHPLLLPPMGLPDVTYTDMNGYGADLARMVWFYLYWTLECVLLLVLVHLFWVRGEETGLRQRLALARRRWTPRVRSVTLLTMLAFGGVGSWIYYNTNVLNEYLHPDRVEAERVRYEKEYGAYRDSPQPRITAVDAEVDIYPHRRALEIRGTYRLRNDTEEPIDAIHLTSVPWVTEPEIRIPGARIRLQDAHLGYSIYDLARPLPPGADLEMEFHLREQRRGFVARGLTISQFSSSFNTHLVENGSFVRSAFYFPNVGYLREMELPDPEKRREHGLPPREPLPSPDAPNARDHAFSHADWIDFESVVSTSGDQIALGPGDLVSEWREGERRYFHYRVSHPYEPNWVFLSGRWEVVRERWNGVEIAVYHHENHSYNVGRMIDAAKGALDTYSDAFGPYPERVLRIVEFPRYARFGESHSTQVLISESSGFIAAPVDDPGTIDYVHRLVAHEVAHEWWGNSTLAALARGRMTIVEGLAEYSALLAIERRYGEEGVRRNLRFLLERYLRGRGGARTAERPLIEAGSDHRHVVYAKAGMAFHALADRFGEKAVNEALARFHSDYAFRGPPFPTTLDLLGYLEEIVPADRREILEDWFEKIVLYDLRVREAEARPRGDGTYSVELLIEARKLRVDGNDGDDAEGAEEREIPIDDWIDVALFGEPGPDEPSGGRVLYLEKHRITGPETRLEILVEEPPSAAGIDPFHRLIDRNPDDNRVAVKKLRPVSF